MDFSDLAEKMNYYLANDVAPLRLLTEPILLCMNIYNVMHSLINLPYYLNSFKINFTVKLLLS